MHGLSNDISNDLDESYAAPAREARKRLPGIVLEASYGIIVHGSTITAPRKHYAAASSCETESCDRSPGRNIHRMLDKVAATANPTKAA